MVVGGTFTMFVLIFLERHVQLFSSGDIVGILIGVGSIGLADLLIWLYCKRNEHYFNSLFLQFEGKIAEWLRRS
jgi:hypothetical protein